MAEFEGLLLGFTRAVGLPLASATLYVTFGPYWYVSQSAVLTGDRSHVGGLADFLEAARIFSGTPMRGGLSPNMQVHLGAVAAFSGVGGLLYILLRHFGKDTPAMGTFQSPRGQ